MFTSSCFAILLVNRSFPPLSSHPHPPLSPVPPTLPTRGKRIRPEQTRTCVMSACLLALMPCLISPPPPARAALEVKTWGTQNDPHCYLPRMVCPGWGHAHKTRSTVLEFGHALVPMACPDKAMSARAQAHTGPRTQESLSPQECEPHTPGYIWCLIMMRARCLSTAHPLLCLSLLFYSKLHRLCSFVIWYQVWVGLLKQVPYLIVPSAAPTTSAPTAGPPASTAPPPVRALVHAHLEAETRKYT